MDFICNRVVDSNYWYGSFILHGVKAQTIVITVLSDNGLANTYSNKTPMDKFTNLGFNPGFPGWYVIYTGSIILQDQPFKLPALYMAPVCNTGYNLPHHRSLSIRYLINTLYRHRRGYFLCLCLYPCPHLCQSSLSLDVLHSQLIYVPQTQYHLVLQLL